MSFLDKIFGSNQLEHSQDKSFWKNIETENDLKVALESSFEQKVAIFKHSTRCHISKTVLKNFENQVINSDKKMDFYFLDLLAHRDLSNKIAEDFGITHQSPQLIVLENGKAVHNASHQSISLDLV